MLFFIQQIYFLRYIKKHRRNVDGTIHQTNILVKGVRKMENKLTFQGADVDWYIKADDIVLKNKNGQPAGNNHAPNNPQQPQHKK